MCTGPTEQVIGWKMWKIRFEKICKSMFRNSSLHSIFCLQLFNNSEFSSLSETQNKQLSMFSVFSRKNFFCSTLLKQTPFTVLVCSMILAIIFKARSNNLCIWNNIKSRTVLLARHGIRSRLPEPVVAKVDFFHFWSGVFRVF